MVFLIISTSLVLKLESSTSKLIDSLRPHIFRPADATFRFFVNSYMQNDIFNYFSFPGVETRTQRIGINRLASASHFQPISVTLLVWWGSRSELSTYIYDELVGITRRIEYICMMGWWGSRSECHIYTHSILHLYIYIYIDTYISNYHQTL